MSARGFVPLLLSAVLAGCGDGDPPSGPHPAAWSSAAVDGIANASDLALDGERILLVAGGGDRRLHWVRRDELADGRTVRAKSVELTVVGESRVLGEGELAAGGYQISDLWGPSVDLVGLAVRQPDTVFVADRTYRVAYWGPISRAPDGSPFGVRLDRAFVIPGGTREGKARSDWRDTSAGIAGLLAIADPARTENLWAVERAGRQPDHFGIWRMDRFGIVDSWNDVTLPGGDAAEVGGITWSGDRFLVVRGEDEGTLTLVAEARPGDAVKAPPGSTGPSVPGAGPWSGIARTPDGVLYLVSGGSKCVLAWRREPTADR